MSEKACYIFNAKNTRVEETASLEEEQSLLSLDKRKTLFERLWKAVQGRIDDKINAANNEVLSEVQHFVLTAEVLGKGTKIPAGLLVTSASPSFRLFEQLRAGITKDPKCIYVSISSADAPNLRTLLRNVIGRSTQQHNTMIMDEDPEPSATIGPKLLGYDFEILHQFCQSHQIERVIITLQNSESFETSIVADFIEFLHIWIDRVPIILLFDVATSASALQDRLPITAIRCLRGQSFDAAKTGEVMESVFEAASEDGKLHFGPAVTRFLFQRTKDYAQNVESFVQSLKYTYMCHMYGNPASAFLDDALQANAADEDLCNTIRLLPSFRSYTEGLVSRKETVKARNLLVSDEHLLHAVHQGIQEAHDIVSWLIGAVQVFQAVKAQISPNSVPSFSKIYTMAMSGELFSSSLYREALMGIRKAASEALLVLLPIIYDKLMTMPARTIEISPDDFEDMHAELKQLYPDSGQGQLEEQNVNGVQRRKPSRNKHSTNKAASKSTGPSSATAYADILARFHDLLESYFKACFIPMTDVFLHEIVFCDSRSLVQNALAPKPRASIERALSRPHDYLGCTCCSNDEGTSSSQPPTAILYQLFVESGALVNVFDLWTAFSEIMRHQHEDEELIMALFFRSLAELKYVGMLKPSRKRVDHLGKVLWKGL